MVLTCICSKIKIIVLSLIGVLRRALCCMSRKRTYSNEHDEVLTGINIQNHSSSKQNNRHVERDWNSWDDSPRTVEEHIEKYREKLAHKSSVKTAAAGGEEEEAEPNYFGDMEPTTIKQAKYLIANPNAQPEKQDFSRLMATVEADIPITTELEDWNESDPAGWDEITNENTKQLIREKRKEIRDQKQRQQRERNPISLQSLQAERLTGNR